MTDKPIAASPAGSNQPEQRSAPTSRQRRGQQQDETLDLRGGPGMPALTKNQWNGLWFGLVLGGVIGAIVFVPVGLIPFSDAAVGWRILITVIIGAFAGGTAGAMYWGGRMPEISGEMDAEAGTATMASHPHLDEPHHDDTHHNISSR